MPPTPDLNAGNLLPSIHVDTLLAHRAKILDTMQQACTLLVEADQLAVSGGFGSQWTKVAELIERTRYARYYASDREHEDHRANPAAELLASYETHIDAGGWNHLLHASGLRSFMDSKARDQWADNIEKRQAPPLTIDNIAATFHTLHEARADMVERGVLEVFRRLSWNYQTNEPCRFGKRLIVSYVRSCHSFKGDKLDDLVRAFCVFDGKPEPDHRAGLSVLMHDATREGRRECENDYLHVRWFKNGNGHVTFKRPDLVDKLNSILTKHHPDALPPVRP